MSASFLYKAEYNTPLYVCIYIWTLVYKYLLESLFSILLSIFSEVELLDYMIIFWGTAIMFSTVGYTILHCHQEYTTIPICPVPWQHMLFFDFLITAIPVGMKGDVLVVLTCISLMIIMLTTFPCVYWPFIHLLGRNICSCPLPIFYLSFCCCCCCWVGGVLYVFWLLIPYQIRSLQMLSLIGGLPFHSVVSFDG